MFDNIKADFRRYKRKDVPLIYVLMEQGLWAIVIFRFGAWVGKVKFPIISHILRMFAYLMFKFVEIFTGISVPASAEIGKGFYVGHFGSVILHSDVKIGENCSVGPGVVIGTRGLGKQGVPVIGNNVYVGVGAKLLGPIRIGHGAKIGANAVVVSDVPDGATAVGVPAQVNVHGEKLR